MSWERYGTQPNALVPESNDLHYRIQFDGGWYTVAVRWVDGPNEGLTETVRVAAGTWSMYQSNYGCPRKGTLAYRSAVYTAVMRHRGEA